MKDFKNFNIENWLVYRLWRISQLAGYQLEDFYTEKFALTPVEWHSIAALSSYAPLSAKELANISGMTQVQMTRTLNSLLKQDLIYRRTDPQDKRRIVLGLSKKGMAVIAEIVPRAQALEKKILSVFEKAERDQFLALLALLETSVAGISDGY